MPIKLKYDTENRILLVTVTERFVVDEIASAFDQIATSSEYPPNVDAIWEFQEVDFRPTNQEIVLKIISLSKKHPQRAGCKVAWIAPKGSVAFGMLRMYQSFAESNLPLQFKIFQDYSESEQWILQSRLQSP